MRPIASPTLPGAAVAVAIVSAITVGAGMGQVRAEDCLAAPNVSSPAGQHWYYRIDRVKRRRCWYLHAPLRGAHQTHSAPVLAHAKIEPPAAPVPVPVADAPAPTPAAETAASQTAANSAPSLPHITVLAVKTLSIPRPSMPAKLRTRSGAGEPAIPQAQANAYSVASENKSGATTFFLIVFGLGLTTFLIAIILQRTTAQASWPLRARPGAQIRPSFGGRGPSGFGSIVRGAARGALRDEA